MTDAAFRAGMKQMAAIFPDRDEDETVKATRGQVYRKVLDYLRDEEFLFAVEMALKYERWFPTPASLISFADEYEPPTLVLPSGRSPEQLEAEREAARGNIRSGTELVRAELVKRGLLAADAPEPCAVMPKGKGER
jgi:hypothetical protein